MSSELIEKYCAGPQQLADAVRGMTPEQINAAPIPGKWSTRQVICHIADFEPILSDRMMRVLVEDNPPLRGGNPDVFAAGLAYDRRDINAEMDYIASGRKRMRPLLLSLSDEQFQRSGIHSERGPLTLLQILTLSANHIPNHIKFIEEKRRAMGI